MHKFPTEFLWGTAASAYQTEGNNINNDWYHYEQIEAKKPENKRKLAGICGQATMQWQNYEQDYDLAQKMGWGSISIAPPGLSSLLASIKSLA